MAAWRYSSSYTPRERSSSRDGTGTSKYGLSSLPSSYSAAERPSRWSTAQASKESPKMTRSNSIEEHGPVWAKNSLYSTSSSLVQKLKDRYNVPDTPKSTSSQSAPPKRVEIKDLSLPLSRTYGRNTTSTNLNSNDSSTKTSLTDSKADSTDKVGYRNYNETPRTYMRADSKDRTTSLYSSRASYRNRSPEQEKSTYEYRTRKPEYAPLESKPKVYTSSSLGSSPATNRYLGNKKTSSTDCMKYGSGSSAGSTPNTPTTPSTERNYILEKFEHAQEKNKNDSGGVECATISLVTRCTSPTQPSSSVYVRTRRADLTKVIETTVMKPKVKPLMVNKEVQVDDLSHTVVNKHTTPESSTRTRSWSTYMGPTTNVPSYSPLSRYSSRISSYTPISSRFDTSERAKSKEPCANEEDKPEKQSSQKIVEPVKSPSPVVEPRKSSPVNSISDKSSTVATKTSISPKPSSPARRNSKSSLQESKKSPSLKKSGSKSGALQDAKKSKAEPSPDAEKKVVTSVILNVSNKKSASLSEDKSRSRSQTNEPDQKTRSRSRTQDSDTDISVSGFTESSISKASSKSKVPLQTVAIDKDKSESESESESESDETATTTTTDSDDIDDVEEITKSTEPSSVKRSITNFLQNIPSGLNLGESPGSRSRLSYFQGGSGNLNKLKFKHFESGERAWWMDSASNVPEGVVKLGSNKSVQQSLDKNLLAPNHLVNRQFSRDKDWLKSSSEDVSDKSRTSPLPPRPSSSISPNNTRPIGTPSPIQRTGDNTIFLEVPEIPVVRQWSEEKPWWLNEEEISCKDNSISVEKGLQLSDHVSETSDKFSVDVKGPTSPDLSNRLSPARNNNFKNSPERLNLLEDEENIDVTPALRRRREQQTAAIERDVPVDFQMKLISEEQNSSHDAENKPFLEECKLACSVRDLTQKLATVNHGVISPTEEKPSVPEVGEMSGMISKAKAGLLKSQSKYESRQTSEDLSSKIKDVDKSEIDIYWKELVDTLERPLRLCELDFTDLTSDDEKDIFGQSRINGMVPPPPPILLPNGPVPAPPTLLQPPPLSNLKTPVPPPPPVVKNKKTVKLFWREIADVPVPNGVNSIWNELTRVSVDANKLELLFESRAKDFITKKQQEQSKSKSIVVLDHKRSNAINIGMTKLPPPRAIKAAILKMDSSVVSKEGIEKLLTMLPTEEEKSRIQDAQTTNPELPLGSAEQFLLTLASISELEARLKLWAFKLEFETSEKEICEPLLDLKQGISILRVNKTFRAILSTLLSVGNFLNGQDAKGFQVEYLSKVPEVKDTVNKHSLLHHLCVIVMEKFPDSTDLYSEIGPVTRASKSDFDEITGNIKKLEDDCKCSWNHLKIIAKHEGQTAMKAKMSDFLADCAERIILIGIIHRRIMCRFQRFVVWLGVPMNRVSTARPNELFKTIAEFALEYRTTRERILQQVKKVSHHRDKSRSRVNLSVEPTSQSNNHNTKKMNSIEAKDDAKLRQLLVNGQCTADALNHSPTWRRHKKVSTKTDANQDDSEILETLIKTANQTPTSRISMKERRRSRVADNK